ncbi:MAG: hypothetical protein AW09_001802 [Candidatus Accumulibacter phosphatis]|uniref:Uncharacterized protein n=1 Tax=Candidatus Accumulibacter phosphatis TaxID=327160 RepID=A0A080LYH8_9PROT|nr:MAG: hypothetical protein AW09_001802 [Candidatus Accumulibacter phosphatis]
MRPVHQTGQHLPGLVGVVVDRLLAAQDHLRLFVRAHRLEQFGNGQWLQFPITLNENAAVGADGHRRAQGFLAIGHPRRNHHHLRGDTGFPEAHRLFDGNFIEGIHRHLDVGQIDVARVRLDAHLDVVIHHPFDWYEDLQFFSPLLLQRNR